MAIELEDLTQKRFGKLIVLGRYETEKRGQRLWKCICDCGNDRIVATSYLNNGTIAKCSECCKKSQKEKLKNIPKGHGMVKTRLWQCWRSMRVRCSYPKTNGYANYGGRGIKVCDSWVNSFENFRDWALANGYNDSLTLDRIDVNKDYSPENCRWSTIKEQSNNKRNNYLITHNGETHTLSEWSDITGISRITIGSRLKKYGWSVERALTVKPNGGGRYGRVS